ncbi:MAG TPA: thermonuclease family protein [Solirubrobacterales bacterium]|nr:thermonuclease family protein [Solirubrobacterales bacterium]
MNVRRQGLGSAVLLLLAAVVLLRPWEDLERLWDEPEPASVRALVTRVVDGDTVEARFDGREEDVRLIGVDTPETVKPGTPVQCFGPQASRFSHRRLEGRRVRLVFGVERRDVYGRMLAYAYLDGHMFNAELLRRGLARTLTIPPNDRFAERFGRLERAAARAGRGLWGGCGL